MKALVVVAGIAAVLALLFFATLQQAGVECEVCVSFSGRQQCGSARAANESDARRTALSTACAPLTRGVTETLACEGAPPQSVRCNTGDAPGGEAR